MNDVAKKLTQAGAKANLRKPARAELIWDGKYDEHGRRVAPLRVALPFQTVETVNESAQDRQKSLLLGPGFAEEEWRNRLVWGDKKYVLPSLLPEFAGKVNLIYIDPPFDTGADFSFTATVPDDPDTPGDDSFSFVKEPSIIEHKAYRDTWGRGLESYLQWFYETAIVLHELLDETGSIYVHLDYHVSHYAKSILDEVFGLDGFQNEIVWKRQTAHSDAKRYNPIHDSIFYYVKSSAAPFNHIHTPYDEAYIKSHYPHTDAAGRRFGLWDMSSPNPRPKMMYEWKGYPSPPMGWRYEKKTMQKLEDEGRIHYPEAGGKPRFIRFLDEMKGIPLQDIWTDLNPINSQAKEATGYDTQKPESLLDRVLRASSNGDALVLDCFCGSGTTAAVAEKLGRRWIACDLGRFAIHTTRKRLLSVPNVRPFIVQNLGKYERQVWATGFLPRTAGEGDREAVEGAEASAPLVACGDTPPVNGGRTNKSASGGGTDDARGSVDAGVQRAYIEFILKLANASPIHGYTWLHGVKAGRMVHVGAVDAPVSVGDIGQIAAEFKRAIGTGENAPKTNGVDVLGWDFAFEMNEVARQQAAAANIQMRFLRIPRDVMDKRAVEQGDIKFFELAALAVDVKTNKRNVHLKLTDFVIPPDDVPEEARHAVKHWSQWIDYWAVDWDNKSDTFHNEWQAYRTRKDKSLQLEIAHTYPEAGDYTIVVKVIDILGNDTTKSVRVRVK